MLSAEDLASRIGNSNGETKEAGDWDGGVTDLAQAIEARAGTEDWQPAPEGSVTEDLIKAAQEALGRVRDDDEMIPEFKADESPIFPEDIAEDDDAEPGEEEE